MMNAKNYYLFPQQTITPFERSENLMIAFDASGNFLVAPMAEISDLPQDSGRVIKGGTAIPGLIDIHVHGGFSVTFGDGQLLENLKKYSAWAAGNGVTGFIMTISGPDSAFISRVINSYVEILENEKDWPGAIPLGLHLEGPYFNKEKHAAFNPNWIHDPDLSEISRYIELGRGWVKHVSMAPELPHSNEVAAYLAEKGVVVSLGHSNTDYETASTALKGNFTHVTHTFNAQSGFHHRAPGVVGAVLTSDSATAEVIGDAFHVHPAAMQMLYRCLGKDRVIVITDAMPGAGLPDGIYELLDQKVTVRYGQATLPDGTIGGSTATMISALNTLTDLAGIPLKAAVQMATFNPAKFLKLEKLQGSIATGKQGNLVILDNHGSVEYTFIKGKLVFSKNSKE